MARIQILPLPPQRVDGFEQTPFVIVIDGLEDGDALRDLDPAHLEYIEMTTGATMILAVSDTLDVAQPLTLTEEQQAELLARLTSDPA